MRSPFSFELGLAERRGVSSALLARIERTSEQAGELRLDILDGERIGGFSLSGRGSLAGGGRRGGAGGAEAVPGGPARRSRRRAAARTGGSVSSARSSSSASSSKTCRAPRPAGDSGSRSSSSSFDVFLCRWRRYRGRRGPAEAEPGSRAASRPLRAAWPYPDRRRIGSGARRAQAARPAPARRRAGRARGRLRGRGAGGTRRRPGLERRRGEGRARLGALHHRDRGRRTGSGSPGPRASARRPWMAGADETATASGFSTGSGWAGTGALTVATGASSSSMSDSSDGRRTKEPSWAASCALDGRAARWTRPAAHAGAGRGSARSAPRRCRRGRGNARAGDADDVGLDHHVVGAADQQQVLDIVPAQQNELPLPVEIVDVDDAEPRLAAARRDRWPGIIRRAPVSLRRTTPKSATRTRMIAKAIDVLGRP